MNKNYKGLYFLDTPRLFEEASGKDFTLIGSFEPNFDRIR